VEGQRAQPRQNQPSNYALVTSSMDTLESETHIGENNRTTTTHSGGWRVMDEGIGSGGQDGRISGKIAAPIPTTTTGNKSTYWQIGKDFLADENDFSTIPVSDAENQTPNIQIIAQSVDHVNESANTPVKTPLVPHYILPHKANSALSSVSPLRTHLKSAQSTYSNYSLNDSFHNGVELLKTQLAHGQDTISELEKKVVYLENELEEQQQLRNADASLFCEASALITTLENDRLKLQIKLRELLGQPPSTGGSSDDNGSFDNVFINFDEGSVSPQKELADKLMAVGHRCATQRRYSVDDAAHGSPLNMSEVVMLPASYDSPVFERAQSALTPLQQSTDAMQQQIAELQTKLAAAEAELLSANGDIFTIRALQDVTNAKNEVENALERTKRRLADAEQRIEMLTKICEDSSEHYVSLPRPEPVHDEVSIERSLVKDLQAQLAHAEASNLQASAKIKSLEGKVTEAKRELQSSFNECSSLKEELKNSVAAAVPKEYLEKQRSEYEGRLGNAAVVIAELQQRVQSADLDVRRAQNEYDSLQALLAAEKMNYDISLTQAKENIVALERKLADFGEIQTRVIALGNKVRSDSSNSKILKNMGGFTGENSDSTEDDVNLFSVINDITDKFEGLVKVSLETRTALDSSIALLESQQGLQRELDTANSDLREHISRACGDMDDLRRSVTALSVENEEKKLGFEQSHAESTDKLIAAMAETGEHRQKVVMMTSEKEELANRAASLAQELEHFRKTHDEAVRHSADLEQQSDGLQTRLLHSLKERQLLENRIAKVAQQYEESLFSFQTECTRMVNGGNELKARIDSLLLEHKEMLSLLAVKEHEIQQLRISNDAVLASSGVSRDELEEQVNVLTIAKELLEQRNQELQREKLSLAQGKDAEISTLVEDLVQTKMRLAHYDQELTKARHDLFLHKANIPRSSDHTARTKGK
jgi:chromosome segregation ATPase